MSTCRFFFYKYINMYICIMWYVCVLRVKVSGLKICGRLLYKNRILHKKATFSMGQGTHKIHISTWSCIYITDCPFIVMQNNTYNIVSIIIMTSIPLYRYLKEKWKWFLYFLDSNPQDSLDYSIAFVSNQPDNKIIFLL